MLRLQGLGCGAVPGRPPCRARRVPARRVPPAAQRPERDWHVVASAITAVLNAVLQFCALVRSSRRERRCALLLLFWTALLVVATTTEFAGYHRPCRYLYHAMLCAEHT